MKYKRLAAAVITASFLGMNIMPAACLASTKKVKEKKEKQSNKVIKSKVSEYRFDYVNTDATEG